ncbi:MAG: sensor histidine kinase [Planctomycetota bacterium]|nr:sensor histidine kinase [Planctomycetota bacterium]
MATLHSPGNPSGKHGHDTEWFFSQVLEALQARGPRAANPGRRPTILRRALAERTAELLDARTRLSAEEKRGKALDVGMEANSRECADAMDTARRAEQMLRDVTRKLLTAHEDERRRVSRDLHDELGQNLTAVNLTLEGLRTAAAADAKELQREVRRSQALLLRAMKKVRRFAMDLRPSLLDHLGLVPALRDLTASFARGCKLDVRFAMDSEELGLGAERATAMYRVAQEALTNVRRHARATRVEITVRRQPGAVQLEVHDNGRAFDPHHGMSPPRRGLGMLCMRERMGLVGGTLVIEPSKGQGTRVLANLPDAEVDGG